MKKVLERWKKEIKNKGDATGLWGDATGLSGNLDKAELTEMERSAGVNLTDLLID